MSITFQRLVFILVFVCSTSFVLAHDNKKKGRDIWTIEKANAWYKKQPWLVASNFTPSYAINQLEFLNLWFFR